MTEIDAINDLLSYESTRREWLLENKGSESGFKPEHGSVVAAYAGAQQGMTEHLLIPYSLQVVALSDENRSNLGTSLNVNVMPELLVNDAVVEFARSFVSELYAVDLSKVSVVLAPQRVMGNDKLGHVYSCRVSEHVIVIPKTSFDPKGVAVMLFAQAAHHTLMRAKGGLASMITDNLTFSMSSMYALASLAEAGNGDCAIEQHLQNLVVWEFAKGLALTPKEPMKFIVSDLGASLMKAYGSDFFKDVVQHLYDAATNGQAMVFGSNHFNGSVLALGLRGRDSAMRKFMAADAGGINVREKFTDAFGLHTDQDILDLSEPFNEFVLKYTPDEFKLKQESLSGASVHSQAQAHA